MRAAAPAALAGEERGPQQPVEGGGDGRVVQQPSPPGVDNASKIEDGQTGSSRGSLLVDWHLGDPESRGFRCSGRGRAIDCWAGCDSILGL